jgi:DNA-binding MarR family transcriptional regulator
MHPITFRIKRAFLASTNFLRRSLRYHHGLTQARFEVLFYVHHGYCDQSRLRRALCLAPSTLTEALQTLERLGLVSRTPNPADRRTRIIQLTKEGLRRTKACIEQWIDSRAGIRMMRNVFRWKRDPNVAFCQMEDFESFLRVSERWFSGKVALDLYPSFHPDD